MRRRSAPPPSAQQMIRDYLGRVSVAATKVLPKGDRLLFVGRTRAAIEAQVGPLASADADDVLSALNTMGDPEDLAKRERERLYSARRRGAAAAPPALWKPAKAPRRGTAPPPPADGRGRGPGQSHRPRPWPHRGGLAGPGEPKPAGPAADAPRSDALPVVPRQADSPEATVPPVAAVDPAEWVQAEPATAGLAGDEPDTAVPDEAGLDETRLDGAQLNGAGPDEAGPDKAGLDERARARQGSGQTRPGQTRRGQTRRG